MTYTIIKNKISNDKIKYQFKKQDNSILTYADFINLLRNRDNEFLREWREVINRVSLDLDSVEIAHFFWECIPVSTNTLNKEFEFVAVNSPDLKSMKQDYSSFQEHFRKSRDGYVVSFPNLSRDATLVTPIPSRESDAPCSYGDEIMNYKDIRKFANNALTCQWNSFWQEVGNKITESLNNSGGATRWMSTHGLSVKYFHVRICNQPKYYEHQEYLRENISQNRQQPQIPNNFQDDYSRWTREQLIAEINRLKTENEKLKNNQTLTSLERQTRLQQNQQRLEQVQSIFNSKDTQQTTQPNNNYLAPLIIGGALLVGLISILVYKKNKKINIRK